MQHIDDTPQMPDINLWQHFRQGDKVALGTLARRHYASLLRYGVTVDADKEFVEDTIQDLFIALWEKHEAMSIVENIKGYLLTALRHRLLRNKMKLVREKTWLERLFSIHDVHNSFEMEWIDTEKDRENNRRIQSVMSSLSPRQREVVQLKFYEGLDNESIADIMGITKQGVANLMVRTLKDLRFAWEQLVLLLAFFT